MAQVAVMTDKTGQQIAKHLRENNAMLEAAFGTLNANIGKGAEVFIVEANVEHNDDGSYAGLSIGTTIGRAIEDITTAHRAGKIVILRVADNENNTSYFAPLSAASGLGTDSVSIEFGSLGQSNPAGSVGKYSLIYVKGLDFMNGLKVDSSGLNASAVFCDVTIGGTKYTNVADALAALVAGG